MFVSLTSTQIKSTRHTCLIPLGVLRFANTPYTTVPETETYSMLLAGLGLFGFVSRNKQKASA